MAHARAITLDLRVGPLGERDVVVRHVTGAEGVSLPFHFDVRFAPASGEPVDPSALVGQEASLSLRRAGEERWVHGVCVGARAGLETGAPWCSLRIAPRLALAAQRRTSRVFQGQSHVDVVRAVLRDWRLSPVVDVRGQHPVRDLTVQYDESDLDLVTRLLAEEGVSYWFEHEEDRHALRIGDATGGFAALEGVLPYREGADGAVEEECVFELRRSDGVVPGKAAVRDFDFRRPGLDLSAEATAADGSEVYAWPGRHLEPAFGRHLAQLRLEEARQDGALVRGRATCARFAPGVVFEVDRAPFEGERFAVIRVEHEASQQVGPGGEIEASYRNRFVAVRAGDAWRPPHAGLARRVRGPQTATVVGPGGEEIHPDEHGRVKIRFHWDRSGVTDDRASAWVRCAQAWAGGGFGALVVPRVGQEVVVRFLDGDPDRPLVTGAVYHAARPPPIPLPADKTRSTLRSSSSPGDAGGNELRFEDAAGEEHVFLQAQRDLSIETAHDKAQRVRSAETLRVANDRTQEVKGEQRLLVKQDDAIEILGSRTLEVAKDRSVRVGGEHRETVSGDARVQVGQARSVKVGATVGEGIGGDVTVTLGGGHEVGVAEGMTVRGDGASEREIDGALVERVGGEREETASGDVSSKVDGTLDEDVEGSVSIDVLGDDAADVGGAQELEVGGAASVEASEVTLEADRLTLGVNGKVAIEIASGAVKVFGAKILIEGSALELKGGSVKKDAPAPAASFRAEVRALEAIPDALSVAVVLRDLDGNPAPRVAFQAQLPDGSVVSGKVDGVGRGLIPSSKAGQVTLSFPDVRAAEGQTPPPGTVEAGRSYPVATGEKADLVVPWRCSMTIAFLTESDEEREFPRYELECKELGTTVARTPKDDLVEGDRLMELRWVGIQATKRYTLRRWLSEEHVEIVFENVPGSVIIDQARTEPAAQAPAVFQEGGG